jgi:hypothetical protein
MWWPGIALSQRSSIELTMSKDGPPSSTTGYRFGGLNAFRANLPSNAINPTGPVATEAEAKARQSLSKFSDYYGRAKTIGQAVSTTQGVSTRRAAALQRINDLKEENRADKAVILLEGDTFRLKWVYSGARKSRLIHEDLVLGIAKVSLTFGSKGRALYRWHRDQVWWTDQYPLP